MSCPPPFRPDPAPAAAASAGPAGIAAPAPTRRAATAGLPCWRSEDLLAGGQEACIEHAGAAYRLRLTSLGKLILTK